MYLGQMNYFQGQFSPNLYPLKRLFFQYVITEGIYTYIEEYTSLITFNFDHIDSKPKGL